MLEPFLLPLLAKIRRELSRLIFVGLLFAYGLSALSVCSGNGCQAGIIPAIIAIMGETRAYLWQGIALSFIVETTGGFVAMTIGLAIDWLKERHKRWRAEGHAEGHAEGLAEGRAENAAVLIENATVRLELSESRQRNLEMQNRMLRAGIDPDTGQPLPHYRNGSSNDGANAGN